MDDTCEGDYADPDDYWVRHLSDGDSGNDEDYYDEEFEGNIIKKLG